MNDEQLLRYSRQIMLPQVDVAGQQRLLDAHVLIIGLGGLGSPAAMYLAAAGVGSLTLADFDTVDLTNLQRQIAHGQADLGRAKVASAATTLHGLNPEVRVNVLEQRLADDALAQAVAAADVVVDASDNFATRFAINQACVAARTPLVSGAAIRLEGQITVFSNRGDSPCYRCLYDDIPEPAASCSESGVLAPLVGIIGSMQAVETIKLLAGIGQTLAGRLLTLDAARMEWREIRYRKDPRCPVCGVTEQPAIAMGEARRP
jgi:molybdopterin/thiamine biosynthesis adenylyltransferase